MRTWHLVREEDETGVSGTGIVAEGVEWTGGRVVMHWLGTHISQIHYDSITEVEVIHGHGGKSRVVFDEPIKVRKPRKARAKASK